MIKIYPLTILIIRVILLACSTVKSVQALHALGGIADRVPSAQCVRTITQKDTATSVNPLVQTNTVMTEFGKCAYIAGKYAGRVTANRERYNSNDLTASHLTLPFGTICQVTNLRNSQMVRVRVNDRFPAGSGRVVLISFKSAEVLDMLEAGVADADRAAGNSARRR